MTSELLVRDIHPNSTSKPDRTASAQVWTLNRPRVRNALNPPLVNRMRDALRAAEAGGTQVVLISGNGPSFCAGADIRFLQSHDATKGETPRNFLASIWDLTIALERSPIVFVAALHGHAVAGGMELALACDVVVAADTTLIGDGHVANNLLPGGGASARMERALGRGPSSWLALTGQLLGANDSAFERWLQDVVPVENLERRCQEVVDALLQAPARAQERYKRLLDERFAGSKEADRERELDAFEHHWVDQNVPEALRLFLENRRAS